MNLTACGTPPARITPVIVITQIRMRYSSIINSVDLVQIGVISGQRNGC